jgi:DMSO/TMAO reductase YedYZ molybdopterin-dependent catalytic subunit
MTSLPLVSTRPVAQAGPERPPMDPAGGFRRVKSRPHDMADAVTATENLFVLAHLGVPRVDPARWSLTIDGLVGQARTLRLGDLKARTKRTVEAVHQCCGNPPSCGKRLGLRTFAAHRHPLKHYRKGDIDQRF